MPRKPRMYLPDMPCHIIQRGNNRDATLFAEQIKGDRFICENPGQRAIVSKK